MKTRGLTQIIGAAVLFAAVGCGEVPRLGGACDDPGAALCDEQRVVLVCESTTWEAPQFDSCSCTQAEDGSDRANCPVPGFVGIARAGRLRAPASSLRLG